MFPLPGGYLASRQEFQFLFALEFLRKIRYPRVVAVGRKW